MQPRVRAWNVFAAAGFALVAVWWVLVHALDWQMTVAQAVAAWGIGFVAPLAALGLWAATRGWPPRLDRLTPGRRFLAILSGWSGAGLVVLAVLVREQAAPVAQVLLGVAVLGIGVSVVLRLSVRAF